MNRFCLRISAANTLKVVMCLSLATAAFASDIKPKVSLCSNGDGTYTASWSYESHFDKPEEEVDRIIPAGKMSDSTSAEANFFNVGPASVPGQPSVFHPGKYENVFKTVFQPTRGPGYTWTISVIANGQLYTNTAGTAYVYDVNHPYPNEIPLCVADLEPVVSAVCRNADGTYTASWGYISTNGLNRSASDITIFAGENLATQKNFLVPDPKSVPGQPSSFSLGTHYKVFDTIFTLGSDITWNLQIPGGELRSASTAAYANSALSGITPICIAPAAAARAMLIR